MTTIREATPADKLRLVEMAARFLLESQYGEIFDGRAASEKIAALVDNVLTIGAIFVAEVKTNPVQTKMLAELKPLTEQQRMRAVMAMSTTQKAILNWGDDYGPDKSPAELVGMLAIVVLPHLFTGLPYGDEIAWWVEPEHRGNGRVAYKLLRSAEDWATRNGANMVKMSAPAGSTVGEFYERIGYRPVETAFIKSV